MKKIAFFSLIELLCVAVNWFALSFGWWWIIPIVGLLIGLSLYSVSTRFLLAFGAGGLGWGLPLAVLAINAPVGVIANVVEGVTGISSTGGIAIIVLTIALGCLLSMAGAWVGITGRSLITFASQVRFDRRRR